MIYEREAILREAITLVGEEAYQEDPIVHNSLQLIIYHDMSKEDALALAVKTLSATNRSMMKNLVTVASSRPLPPIIIEKDPGGNDVS